MGPLVSTLSLTSTMNKLFVVAVFACVAAIALADDYYKPGFKRTKNAIVARYNNAERQEAVNDKARYVGSGTGTEKYDGVPGTGLDFGYYGYRPYDSYNRGYDRHDRRYGYDRYDDDGYYGYGRYDRRGYGYDRYDRGYGYDDRY